MESNIQKLLKKPQNIALVISYISTFIGFVSDIFKYVRINEHFLLNLNMMTLPFLLGGFIVFLLNRETLRLSAIILIAFLIVNLTVSNFYLFINDKPDWEYNYIRDTILMAVFIIISGLLLSRSFPFIINIWYCISVILIWIIYDNNFVDHNAVFMIAMMTGFTFGIDQFTDKLRRSLLRNEKLQAIVLQQKEELLRKENEVIANQVSSLEDTVEEKDRKLISKAMMLAKEKEISNNTIKKLNDFSDSLNEDKRKKLQKIINEISTSQDELHWKEFQIHFENLHQKFYTNLKKSFLDLTPGELRLASFIKLNLTSKEIALLTNNTKESVDVARSRLRKKFGLKNSDKINNFLEKF